MTEIGILLPARNAAATVGAALRSLQEQTYSDFECLVIDDGSIDGTFEEVRRTVEGDRRFFPIRQDHHGIARTLGRAADLCGCPLLARQDADDVSEPSRLQRQRDFLAANPEIGVLGTGTVTVRSEAATDGGRRYERWVERQRTPRQIANALWTESPIPHPTVMMRRSHYRQAGGYRDSSWPEDYDLWLRLRRLGVAMTKLPEPLYRWTDRPDRASRKLPQYATERFLACRAHHLSLHLDGRATVVWGAGRDGKRAARQLLLEGVRIDGFLDIDPRKIGRTARDRPIWSAAAWLGSAPGKRSSPGSRSELELPELTRDHPIVLAAVGTEGAREEIQRELSSIGWHEGEDFLCIA